MKLASANKVNRKFGGAQWRDLLFFFFAGSHADSEAPIYPDKEISAASIGCN
jgi:hypothetical protein